MNAEPWTPDWWAKREKRREVAERRRPPMPVGPFKAGQCRWCAGEIRHPEGHKRAGEINQRRSWHAECVWWQKVAANSSDQRWAMWRRDKGCCALCGVVMPETRLVGFRPYGTRQSPQVSRMPGYARQDDKGEAPFTLKMRDDDVRYCPLDPVSRSDWDADHIVPLWSVTPVPLDMRGCIYGLANLWTLCQACHVAKTKREAAARAVFRGQQRIAP